MAPWVALLIGAVGAAPQEPSLPIDLQLRLLTKVLTFDRSLERFGPDLVIGVVYQPANRESSRVREELARWPNGAGPIEVAGVRFRTVDVPLDGDHLPAALPEEVDVLYLAPLRAVDPRVLLREARHRHLLTVTGSESHAGMGPAIALLVREGRPHLLIDLTAARAAGSDFSSRLLRLAEVRQ
jgi:hypothetical protein